MMGTWENEPRKTTIRAEEAHASSYGRPPSSWLSPQRCAASWSVYVALYGGTAAYAGVLAAVFSGAAAVVRLLSGPLIDGRGRRIVMLFGFAVLIVGTVGPLFTHDVAPFVVFRILQGAGFSAVTTASATAAASTT